MATGFGPEGVVVVDMLSRVVESPQIFYLDTGFLFSETHELRERLGTRYGIEFERVEPELSVDAQASRFGDQLWTREPDRCCSLRKVVPLRRRLRDLDAWITSIRRDQTPSRAASRPVEWDTKFELVKINPLATWSSGDVWSYIQEHDLPYNVLHDSGYPSIGCTNCTRAVQSGEAERAGRWSWTAKVECGLHG